MTPAAKRTLQQAAAVANRTVSEFLLDSNLTAAFEILADRRVLSEHARVFCERFGFRASPVEPTTLMMTVEEVVRMISLVSRRG